MTQILTIHVKLPNDRDKTGTLELIDPITELPIAGPFPVLGRAARDTADKEGNPGADSLKLFGDTPLGSYRIERIQSNGRGTTRPEEKYGAAGSIVMDPVSGDAAKAKANGRTGLLIHAGRQPKSPTPLPSHLVSTNGCLRMLEDDLKDLIKKIETNSFLFPGSVKISISRVDGPIGDIDESVKEGDPPPMDGGDVILPLP